MRWELALKKIALSGDRAEQEKILALLDREVAQGRLGDPVFVQQIDTIFAGQHAPAVLTGLKRISNRVRSRFILGKDLLRLTGPELDDGARAEILQSLEELQSVYDETRSRETEDFKSRYQVLERLGQGGMSEVFKGIRRSDNMPVAIKYLKKEYFSSPSISERFNRECRLCLDFDHPNLVRVFEVDRNDTAGFMVMEYLPLAGTDTLLADPALDTAMALSIIRQAAQALCYIHDKGIVHRDVKLSNLLVRSVDPGGGIEVALSDFGISRDLKQEGLTVVGTRMGTEFYCAPEQQQAPEKVDQRADIYSLGVCLYRLFSRNHYPAGNFPAISECCPDAPDGLDDLAMVCLENDPRDRLASARDFLSALDRLAPAAGPQHKGD